MESLMLQIKKSPNESFEQSVMMNRPAKKNMTSQRSKQLGHSKKKKIQHSLRASIENSIESKNKL